MVNLELCFALLLHLLVSDSADFALSRHVGSSGSVAIQWGFDAVPWSTWNCLPLLHYYRLAVTVCLTSFRLFRIVLACVGPTSGPSHGGLWLVRTPPQSFLGWLLYFFLWNGLKPPTSFKISRNGQLIYAFNPVVRKIWSFPCQSVRNLRSIAEERVGRKCGSLRVLNSYWAAWKSGWLLMVTPSFLMALLKFRSFTWVCHIHHNNP